MSAIEPKGADCQFRKLMGEKDGQALSIDSPKRPSLLVTLTFEIENAIRVVESTDHSTIW